MTPERIVVVGASTAGVSAAEALREDGFAGQLTIVGAEPYPPYHRPVLSKELLLGEYAVDEVPLVLPGELDAEWRLGRVAVGLDGERRVVSLDDGSELGYDGLVIATGSDPRLLPRAVELDGVFALRTLDDALAIAECLDRRPSVLIAGGGWIGLEVAAVCRRRRLPVTIIDPEISLLESRFGTAVGERIAALHRDHGVRFEHGARVERFAGESRLERVHLSDGRAAEFDLAIAGVGVNPTVCPWLEHSDLDISEGVRCDSTCAAIGAEGVVAAGDVARWAHPRFGLLRVEHWTNAVEQGQAAARTLLAGPGAAEPYDPILSFWSQQYGVRIQSVGVPDGGDEIEVLQGEIDGDGPFLVQYRREGRAVGAVAFDMPKALLDQEAVIDAGLTV